MNASSSSREAVLGRIRAACSGLTTPVSTDEIPRAYERHGNMQREAAQELFEERLHEYGAETIRVEEAQLGSAIATMIHRAGLNRVVVPAALPIEWQAAGVKWIIDHDLTPAQIETAEGVLTGASIAIACTGTIVLQHGAFEGRRLLSLLPDHHFCVLREDQVVETLPEALEWIGYNPALPTTLISGPSATADIEMTRVKGVHGPRHLHVLLVASAITNPV